MINWSRTSETKQRPRRGNAPIRFLADQLTGQNIAFSGYSTTTASAQTTFSRRFFCGEILLLIGKISRLFLLSTGSISIKSSPSVS